MRAKKYWFFVGVATLFLFGILGTVMVGAGRQEDIRYDKRAFLKGLNGVGVVVEVSAGDEKFMKEQFTTQVQTDVELELRQYGLKVLTEEEVEKTLGRPVLTVLLMLRKDATQVKEWFNWAYTVEHTEDATLVRLPKGWFAPARCWRSTLMGRGDRDYIKQRVKDTVREYINDHLAANLKEAVIIPTNTLYKPTDPNQPRDEQKQ
jgi:hypothetical protein